MTTGSQDLASDHPISPLDAFHGSIAPTKLGSLYRAGLTLVAFAMVVLPMIYIGLIVLTGWGVLYHLTNNNRVLFRAFGNSGSSGYSGLLVFLAYVGPAIMGVILIFFMVKPFFARRAEVSDPLVLEPSQEPLLFTFVEKLCALIRAPKPCRISVDCQVNASASLSRGFWSKDLVLTIGLPLASGLDMQQFAGVLAHEFGHFAQGAGMRLTYVIRKINFWFARVVYERDEWDMKLEHAAKSIDVRFGIVLHAARGCVWLTRRILRALMLAGHGISCFMLRQMEYDADSYEAKLAGSDAFESTAARLRTLNIAAQYAYEDVRQSWASSRLPENLPLLINHRAGSLPAEIQEKMKASVASIRTRWFDTHPSDPDRVRAVRALNEQGIFRLAAPATGLFTDFAALSKTVTEHQYRHHFKLEFTSQNLVPAEETLRESFANAERDALLRKFYGEVDISLRPLLTSDDLAVGTEEENNIAAWRAAREECSQFHDDARKASTEWRPLHARLTNATTAHRLARAGFSLNMKEFGLPESANSIHEQEIASRFAIEESSANISERLNQMDPFMNALRRRVAFALRFARRSTGSVKSEEMSKIEELSQLLVAVAAEMPRVYEISTKTPSVATLSQYREHHSDPAAVDKEFSEIVAELESLVRGIQERLAKSAYPFPHPSGALTVAEYARSEKKVEHDWLRTYLDCQTHVERLFELHYRLIGRIIVAADRAEKMIDNLETPNANEPNHNWTIPST